MKTNNRELHWSAVVGVGCSFWLLFWLLIIVSSFYDIQDLTYKNTDILSKDPDIEGLNNTLRITGVFALWAAYRAKKRLDLLKNGVFRSATIGKETGESYDYNSGITGKVTTTNYYYRIDDVNYSNTIWWTFGLKGKKSIEIVYNSLKPSYSRPVKFLRAHFDAKANQWRSSMWHVIPRLTLLVLILAGFVVKFIN
jgi:hypothetical protein